MYCTWFFGHTDIVDSATLAYYNEDVSAKPNFINHFINIRVTENVKQGVLYVKIQDATGQGVAENFIFIDKEDPQNRHYFLATANGMPVNGNVHEARYVDVSNTCKPASSLYCKVSTSVISSWPCHRTIF